MTAFGHGSDSNRQRTQHIARFEKKVPVRKWVIVIEDDKPRHSRPSK